MSQLLASRTVIQEEAPSVRGIAAVATAITLALGVTERGPVGEANFFTSFDEFSKKHGGHTLNGDLTLAAGGFFGAGGGALWGVRTVHYTDAGNPLTKTSAKGQYDLQTEATSPSAGTVLGTVIGPFDLEPGYTLSIAVDGGGPSTATFTATAGARENTNGAPYALTNAWTLLVALDGAAAQTITFLTAEFVAIGAATLQEVANVINAKLTGGRATLTSGGTRITITSDRRGTSSSVNVTGGTAAATLGFAVGSTAGTGNVANIDAVTVAEVKTIVEAAVAGETVSNDAGAVRITSNTTGGSSSIAVQAASTADSALGLDNATHTGSTGAAVATTRIYGKTDGGYAGQIKIGISTATSDTSGTPTVPTTDEFNLVVYRNGIATETFPNLTMDPTDARYAPTILNDPSVNASNLISFTDLLASGSATQRRPANTPSPVGPLGANAGTGTISSSGTTVTGAATAFTTQLAAGMTITASGQTRVITNIGSSTSLTTDTAFSPAIAASTIFTYGAGWDGLIGIADADFIGQSTVNGKTGLRCFDVVQDGAILIVPGRATAAMHDAMITYAEVTREMSMFTILDPPANQTAVQMVDYVTNTGNLLERSEFAAIYWPRVKVSNPSRAVFGNEDLIVVPPSGIIAGTYARIDARTPGGVYVPPAGTENGILPGVVGFETSEALDLEKRNLVYPKRINPISKNKNGGAIFLDGTRTLKSTGNFPTIAERRGAINIEQSVKTGIEFARHQNNTDALRKAVSRSVENFLIGEMGKGAFRSNDPNEAFFVDFGDGLNPVSEQFAGRLNGRIGIATPKPIDFIVMSFSQDTRALDAELAASQS